MKLTLALILFAVLMAASIPVTDLLRSMVLEAVVGKPSATPRRYK